MIKFNFGQIIKVNQPLAYQRNKKINVNFFAKKAFFVRYHSFRKELCWIVLNKEECIIMDEMYMVYLKNIMEYINDDGLKCRKL